MSTATTVLLHLKSQWPYYTQEQRDAVCLFFNLDQKASIEDVVCKFVAGWDNVSVSLLALLLSFTPSLAPCTETLPLYRVAGICVNSKEFRIRKTLLYVPVDIYRHVKYQDGWTDSKGVCITFHKYFDYANGKFYLPKKCTTQVICLEDALQNPLLSWEWTALRDSLSELKQYFFDVTKSINNLAGLGLSQKPTEIHWKRDFDTVTQSTVELFVSRAASLFIYHQLSCRWKAQNGVVFSCSGDCPIMIQKDCIRLCGRESDVRFTVPRKEWEKCSWTPEQVGEALDELSQAVRASNQSVDLAGMDIF